MCVDGFLKILVGMWFKCYFLNILELNGLVVIWINFD